MNAWAWAGLGVLALALARRASARPASSDKVTALSGAIAKAEGFFALDPTVKPRRLNNPGDITDLSGTVKAFATVEEGWQALYDYVGRMLSGEHAAYDPDETFAQAAVTYTGADNAGAWALIVCGELGITPDWTLREYAEAE